MSKVINLFKNKKVEENKQLSYQERTANCINFEIENSKSCECIYCKDKQLLSSKLAQVSQWLVLNHIEKTKHILYDGDWLEIMDMATSYVVNHLNKKGQ